MKISFLVTYYQQEKYVRESMESLLTLDKPEEWEILIGDDGSSDGTVEAARDYAERDPDHIRLFIMDREAGRKYNPVERASMNRLNLVRHATGDCFCLLDGDDFYSETDFIPQAIDLLEANPEVHAVAFDTWMYREGQPRKAEKQGDPTPVPTPRRKYLRWQYTHAGACVFRYSFSEERLRALEGLGMYDDNGITLNALNGGRLIRVRRPVYAYRQAAGSVYTQMRPEERAALNLMGLGACLRIMDGRWERDVVARYATAVWMGWFMRKNLRENLPPEKYENYVAACRRMGFAQGANLLRWNELSGAEKRDLRRYVLRAGRLSPPRVLYALGQIRGRGAKA